MNRLLSFFVFTALTALAGCMPDCDTPAPEDGGVDASVPPWPALMAATQSGLESPDLSCLGTRTAPVGGAAETIATPVVPFGAPPSVTLPGLPVRFFLDGPATADCAAPGCLFALANDAGIASAELPRGGWLTTEVAAIDGPDAMRSFMRTLEQHWAAGEEATINTFNRGTLAGFEAALGAPVDATRGIAAGRVLDCQGRPLTEARLRYFDAAGAEVFAGSRNLYFDGMLPPGLDLMVEATATDGRFATIDLPASVTRVEAWGSIGDTSPTRIACEAIQVEPDTLTVQVLRPTRADAPSSCGAP